MSTAQGRHRCTTLFLNQVAEAVVVVEVDLSATREAVADHSKRPGEAHTTNQNMRCHSNRADNAVCRYSGLKQACFLLLNVKVFMSGVH